MSVNFSLLPDKVVQSIIVNFKRLSSKLNELEVRQSFHGLAKMSSKWSSMSKELKDALFASISNLPDLNHVTLATIIHSLGLMECLWEGIPKSVKSILIKSASGRQLNDQTISNTIYGMCLMQAKWEKLEDPFKKILINNLSRKDVLLEDTPQHIANILWGLSKMDVSWEEVPKENLELSFSRCVGKYNSQGISNCIYGFSLMDASWNNLSMSTKYGIYKSIQLTSKSFSAQVSYLFDYLLKLVNKQYND
jgi:hypothetical protein